MKNSRNLDKFRASKAGRIYTKVYLRKVDDAGKPVTEWEPHQIYIGLEDGHVDDLWLHGARLSAILRAEFTVYANPIVAGDVIDITEEFWKQYEKDGRCTFDRAHSTFFLEAHDRFTVINKTRRCNWCNEWHKEVIEKVVEVKRVSVWTPA